MCGRYVQAKGPGELANLLGPHLVSEDLPAPSWNVKPTQQIPILIEDHKQPGTLRLEPARWALTPIWSKTPATKMPLFNARIETVLEKPSFKASVKNRRCLIPADGFYEWTGEKSNRVPHYIHRDHPIYFAGLSSWWHEPGSRDDEGWHLTATILTMDAYGMMENLHHRIPVFLADEMRGDWLSPEIEGSPELLDAIAETSMAVGSELKEHVVAPLKGDSHQLMNPL